MESYMTEKSTINNKKSEKFRIRAIQWVDKKSLDNSALDDVATGIVNMGKALDTRQAPAMVAIVKDQDYSNFRLYLNSEDFSDFTPEQRAGVVWHELNHILNNHLQESKDHRDLGMDNSQLVTVAQEIICNDTVLFHGVDLPMMYPDEDNEGIFYGEKILGYNCFGKTTKEVYDLLEQSDFEPPQNLGENNNPSDNPGDSDQGSQGQSCGGIYVDPDITDEELKDITEQIIQEVSNGMQNPDELLSDPQGSVDQSSASASMSSSSSPRDELLKKGDVKLEYFTLLKRIDPKIVQGLNGGLGHKKMKEDWRFTPRKLMGLQGKNTPLLPTMRPYEQKTRGENNLPLIVFAVDQSGSIGEEDARKTRELATTIPKDLADIHMVAFADDCKEMNKEGEILGNIGYGTSFYSVAEYVDNTLVKNGRKQQDISIVMITDGYDYDSRSLSSYNFRWFFCDLYERPTLEFNNILQTHVRTRHPIDDEDVFNVRDIAKW